MKTLILFVAFAAFSPAQTLVPFLMLGDVVTDPAELVWCPGCAYGTPTADDVDMTGVGGGVFGHDFSDPWAFLISSGPNWVNLDFKGIRVKPESGKCDKPNPGDDCVPLKGCSWVVTYTWSATSRTVQPPPTISFPNPRGNGADVTLIRSGLTATSYGWSCDYTGKDSFSGDCGPGVAFTLRAVDMDLTSTSGWSGGVWPTSFGEELTVVLPCAACSDL